MSTTVVINAPDDRTPIRLRRPDAERLRDLQTDRDYQYQRDPPPSLNPLKRFLYWLLEKIGNISISRGYVNVGQYVLLATIAGVVIYLLMKAEVLGFLFPNRAKRGTLAYETVSEDIHAINFEAALDEAISQRNYRLAVRLLYLQTLKYLTDANQIAYKPDKTNRQYVAELTGQPQQTGFASLTRQFEYVWYGDFPVDHARFADIQNQFQTFQQSYKLNVVY